MAKSKNTVAPVSNKEDMIALIEKKFGAGSVMVGRAAIVNVSSFSTGVPSIDVALGCGGIPEGRIIEIFGPESSGKTTTCLQFVAACQKHYFKDKERYGVAAFIDAEHALDPVWAGRIGVDMDNLMLSQPGHGEEAFDIMEIMIRSRAVDLIIVDSAAALVPECELIGELSDSNIGAQARMMSKALRKLKGIINDSKTTVVFINQIREKIGVMFGSPEVTPGGRALKFYASIRGDIRRGSSLKDGEATIGFRTKIKIIKNKVAAPFTTAEYDVCVGHPSRPLYGIDSVSSLLDVASSLKIVTTKGSWYEYDGKKIGNGLAQAAAYLREDAEMYQLLFDKTYNTAFDSRPDPDLMRELESAKQRIITSLNDSDDDGDDSFLDDELLDTDE